MEESWAGEESFYGRRQTCGLEGLSTVLSSPGESHSPIPDSFSLSRSLSISASTLARPFFTYSLDQFSSLNCTYSSPSSLLLTMSRFPNRIAPAEFAYPYISLGN